MQGDTDRLISCAGKEVHLKLVIQEIPTYSMSCFKLTKKFCKGISLSMVRYSWSSPIDHRSLHWIDWDSLGKPKVTDGMGFQNLELFNLAFLDKHGWRLITSLDSLCARASKGEYFPLTDFMEATFPRCVSTTWQSILARRQALVTSLIKRIGDGSSVSIWHDSWIPSTLPLRLFVHIGAASLSSVSELIDADSESWKIDVVGEHFIPPEEDAILNILLR